MGFTARRRVWVVPAHYLALISLCAGQKVSDNTVRSIAYNARSNGMFVGEAEHPDAQEDLVQLVFQRLCLREARMGNIGAGNPDIGVDSLNARGPNLTTAEYSGITPQKCLKHLFMSHFGGSSEHSTDLLEGPLRRVISVLNRTSFQLIRLLDPTGPSLVQLSDTLELSTPQIKKTSELLYTAYSMISAASESFTQNKKWHAQHLSSGFGLPRLLKGFMDWLGQ